MDKIQELKRESTIIFDLGGVIVNISYEATLKCLQKRAHGLDPRTFNGKPEQLWFYSDYEVGKISTEAFIAAFNEYEKVSLTLEEFKACWNQMICDIPRERVELLRALKKSGIKIYCLSNINALHEAEVDRLYAELKMGGSFAELFDKVYYSHRIHLRKPTHEIFEYVLRDQGLLPNQILFIDDSAHHIQGAGELGIKSVHLVPPTTILDL